VLLSWLLSLTSSAWAQQAPDPDEVFAPLLEQAERDRDAGRPLEAHARAQAFLARVSVASAQAGRAHLVINVTRTARGAEPSAEVVFEPLVIAAEADAVAGRSALAQARLSAAMSLVPADSALAARARNLYSLASRGGATTTAPVAPASPPVAAPPPAAPVPQVIVVSPPPAAAPAAPAPAPKAAANTYQIPTTPRRDGRTFGERAELRVAGAALGLLAGIYLMTLIGADDPLLFLTVPVFLAGGLVLSAGLLDGDEAMPEGVPAAISTGMLVGFGDGLLLWGLARNELDSASGVMGLLTLGALVGGGVGVGFGYAASPTVAESRFVVSASLWGAWIGLMSSMALSGNADQGWTSMLIGYNVALAAAMLTSGITDISLKHLALINGTIAVGGLVGLMVAGVVAAKIDQDGGKPGRSVLPSGIAIGCGVGVLMALLIPDETRGEDESASADASDTYVDFAIAPTQGGATFSLFGTL